MPGFQNILQKYGAIVETVAEFIVERKCKAGGL